MHTSCEMNLGVEFSFNNSGIKTVALIYFDASWLFLLLADHCCLSALLFSSSGWIPIRLSRLSLALTPPSPLPLHPSPDTCHPPRNTPFALQPSLPFLLLTESQAYTFYPITQPWPSHSHNPQLIHKHPLYKHPLYTHTVHTKMDHEVGFWEIHLSVTHQQHLVLGLLIKMLWERLWWRTQWSELSLQFCTNWYKPSGRKLKVSSKGVVPIKMQRHLLILFLFALSE